MLISLGQVCTQLTAYGAPGPGIIQPSRGRGAAFTSASGSSPDDPALAGYWAQRRRKVRPPLDSYTAGLLSRQDGRCTLCGENLLTRDQPPQSPEGRERWFLQVARQAIKAGYLLHHDTPGAARGMRTHLIHDACSRQRRQPAAPVLKLST
jgi:RNA-directed DNA polymerase